MPFADLRMQLSINDDVSETSLMCKFPIPFRLLYLWFSLASYIGSASDLHVHDPLGEALAQVSHVHMCICKCMRVSPRYRSTQVHVSLHVSIHAIFSVEVCIQSLHLCFSCVFPELSLTPENLSTVLDSMDDGLWGRFSDYVNIPCSEQERIQSQYSSNRERKQAAINSLNSGHPALSWRLVAHALYQMGPVCGGDSNHKALDRLQQLFPTGTATPVTMWTAHFQRVCLTCAHHMYMFS